MSKFKTIDIYILSCLEPNYMSQTHATYLKQTYKISVLLSKYIILTQVSPKTNYIVAQLHS